MQFHIIIVTRARLGPFASPDLVLLGPGSVSKCMAIINEDTWPAPWAAFDLAETYVSDAGRLSTSHNLLLTSETGSR